MPPVDGAQHGSRVGLAQGAAAEGNQLVHQAQRVAHAAFRGSREQRRGRGFELEILGGGDEFQALADEVCRQPFETELQTAREHGDRQFLRIGGRQQEFDVRRRLFEGFQQRIEGVVGQHVHFVDEVHLVAAASGRVLHVVQQFARIINLGAGGRVDLDEVDEAAFVDFAACGAYAAWIGADAGFAVERLGEDARHRRLADAASTGEQECVMHFAAIECVGQRAQHVFLPDHFGEPLGAPFAR